MRTAGPLVPLLLAAPLLGQTIVNTIPHLGSFAGAVAYDGVTNEVVVIDETATTVTFYDRVSHAQVHQYPAPAGSLPIGAQIDVSTGRLWVVGENEIVYEIDGAKDNLQDGINPFFPYTWNLHARQGFESGAALHMAKLEMIRADREALRQRFARWPVTYSAFLLTLWDFLDQRHEAGVRSETAALRQALTQGANHSTMPV